MEHSKIVLSLDFKVKHAFAGGTTITVGEVWNSLVVHVK